MGWWNTAVLGGDPALDILDRIETALGCGALYPLDAITDPGKVASELLSHGLSVLAADNVDPGYPGLSTQVVGVVALAVGAPLGVFADAVRHAASIDDWAAQNVERHAEMDRLIAAVGASDGVRVVVPSPGLFDTMAER